MIYNEHDVVNNYYPQDMTTPESSLKEGVLYTLRVVGTLTNSKGEQMFELHNDEGDDQHSYRVFPLRSQKFYPHPAYLYCYVKRYDYNGLPLLEQDEYALFTETYKANQVYTFKVEEIKEKFRNTKTIYIVSSEFGLKHAYLAQEGEKYNIGDEIKSQVTIQKNDNRKATLFFHHEDIDGDLLIPRDVFEGCKHLRDYEPYFQNIDQYRDRSTKFAYAIDSMHEKISKSHRLWIFDYINALNFLIVTSPKDDLAEIEHICQLVIDLELWILEESGLLNKFSPEKREETTRRAEQVIGRAEAILKAISIIQDDAQVAYLEDVLAKLRKSAYLRNREQQFAILYNLVNLQRDFLRNNLAAFAELIDFTIREFTDTYVLERIVSNLSIIINTEKRNINQELHYLRNTTVDSATFSDLIIGIGTLLNFHAINELETRNDYEINAKSLFQDLCKYLSMISSTDDAKDIINKAIEASIQGVEHYTIKVSCLREVSSDPKSLINYIKNMRFSRNFTERMSHKKDVLALYQDGKVAVSFLPSVSILPEDNKPAMVYSFPGTILNVASVVSSEVWENNQPISYYKKKWKDLLAVQPKFGGKSLTNNGNYVHITTKSINPQFSNLVFCSADSSTKHLSGAINSHGYLPSIWWSKDLVFSSLFEGGMHFLGVPVLNDNGKVEFHITDNLREYSNYLAEDVIDNIDAIYLGFDEVMQKAILLTENGILCEAEMPNPKLYRLGWTYEIVILDSQDPDRFPEAQIIKSSSYYLNKEDIIREQLKSLSAYNVECGVEEMDNTELPKSMPFLHLLIDNYLRFFTDKAVLYNLYHVARLFALLEGSNLAGYYSSCIQYIEMVDGFANGGLDYSIPDFDWDDNLLSMFPSLQGHTEMYNLLKNFGSENDIEYLYRLSMREGSGAINRMARISLAASLIESVSDDERPMKLLRELVAHELGQSVENKDQIIANIPIDDERDTIEDVPETNYGVEGQSLEFKTSVVYPAGDDSHTMNMDEQMKVIMRTIAGFLNAKGGDLLIGVKDDGTPSGIESDLSALDCNIDKYERVLRDHIVREFNKDVNGTIEITFVGAENCRVCRLHVPAYTSPIAFRNDFFQRQGNEVRVLKGNDLVMFIRRRIEGKETIVENSGDLVDVPENLVLKPESEENTLLVSANSTMSQPITPSQDESESFELVFYNNGSCLLGHNLPEQDSVATIVIDTTMKNLFIIQCYDNGCVNKMPVRNLYNMQYNFLYKNALYKEAVLQKVMILSNEDYLLVTSRQHTERFVKIYPIIEISAHSALGLKGNQVLSQNYEAIESWNLIPQSLIKNCEKLIYTSGSSLGKKILSPAIRSEVIWLNNNIFNTNATYMATPQASPMVEKKIIVKGNTPQEQAFAKFLNKSIASSTVNSYLNGMTVLSEYIHDHVDSSIVSIYDITDAHLMQLCSEMLGQTEAYVTENERRHHQLSAALNKYLKFLEE